MGTHQRPKSLLFCLVMTVVAISRGSSMSPELKSAVSSFTSAGGANGWLPMLRPAGLSSAAASAAAAVAAAAAMSGSHHPLDDTTADGRQRALQHPVIGRVQHHLAASPKRLLRPLNDGFYGSSNKVEVFAPPPPALIGTFGQAAIRKPSALLAQESRFPAFDQSAPSIFFVQPPPAPSNPSLFTLPPHQHHGAFPLFSSPQPTFFRTQPQHEFRFIGDQSAFSGLTHQFIPPADRNKQLNRYLPSVTQSFELHANRQPLVRPLVPSPQFNDESRPSLSPITFPPQRSSPAPFKPFPEQRLPFLSNEAHQQQSFPQAQFQQHTQFQPPPLQQSQQQQLLTLPEQQSQLHLQQRPVEKLRITRPYFEEQRPGFTNTNLGPQTFPTQHSFIDFQPPTSSFFFPEQTQTEPPTTTTTEEAVEKPSSSPSLPAHMNEVQPTSENPKASSSSKRKNQTRRRKPTPRPATTTTPTPPTESPPEQEDFSIATIPPSVLPESVHIPESIHQYLSDQLLPTSDSSTDITSSVGTNPSPSAEAPPVQHQPQEQSASNLETAPTVPHSTDSPFLNHQDHSERFTNALSTEAPHLNEDAPVTVRPRRKKPTNVRNRFKDSDIPTTPQTFESFFHREQSENVPVSTLSPQSENPATTTPSAVPSTATTLSSRLRPRIRFNSTRPSFSLKDYRGRLTRPTPSEATETSSPSTMPSSIPPRVRYPSRVRTPYRPSATEETSTVASEAPRSKNRYNSRQRTTTTTPTPDTASSPTETSEAKSSSFKPNISRFRPGTGKYVSRFRMTSTTEAAMSERAVRTPAKTTGVYSVRRPAPTEATEMNSAHYGGHETPTGAGKHDLDSRPSNQPYFNEFTHESRSSTSSEMPLDSPLETPVQSEDHPESHETLLSDVALTESSKASQDAPDDTTPEAFSVSTSEVPFEYHSEATSEVPASESSMFSTPSPKPTGTALEQDNEVLPLPAAEPSDQESSDQESSPDDMMLSPSSRVADLTASPNNKYDNPQLRLKSALPPRISFSTDDPILPIEAFFNSWNRGGKTS